MINLQATSQQPKVVALVVCFHPNPQQLLALAHQLRHQVEAIYLLNNGGISAALRGDLLLIDQLEIHDFDGNIGVAAALNFGMQLAEKTKANFVVTFDQDSAPQIDHVKSLVGVWYTLDSKKAPAVKIGAIGPMFYDGRGGLHEYGFLFSKGLWVSKHYSSGNEVIVEADILITSGMLVPLSVWQEGMLFNDQLFIDLVDTDWCLRAKAKGYTNFGCFSVRMKHDMSDAHPIRMFGISVLRYGYLRRYYYFRNCVYLLPKEFVPLAYKIRLFVTLLVMLLTALMIDEYKIKSFQFIVKGVCDGFSGKLGRFQED